MTLLMETIYKAKRNKIPLAGAWVSIKGNPYAKRGLRIPPSIRAEGVKHLDIYWAYNEHCPWTVADRQLERYLRSMDLEAIDYILENNGITEAQLTKMDLHTPSSKTICMWAGEVAPFSQDLIDMLLASESLETISFGGMTEHPIWDEEIRDILGSLMLDGLNIYQAQNEVITAGMELPEIMRPNHFYRPIGWYYNTFCEEPEYEAWWSPESRMREMEG